MGLGVLFSGKALRGLFHLLDSFGFPPHGVCLDGVEYNDLVTIFLILGSTQAEVKEKLKAASREIHGKGLYFPSPLFKRCGFCASAGIFHVFPSKTAPYTLPSAQQFRTLLSEIPHFSAISFTEHKVILSPPLF